MTDESDEVLNRVEDGVGVVTLNRPRAINSLNQGMVNELSAVAAVEQDGSARWCSRCWGARPVRRRRRGGRLSSARADGIRGAAVLVRRVSTSAPDRPVPKTYVSLMDGIVMGGGVGVGAHANTRVVTDTSKIAMPEVGIGFIPDVGGAYLLSRAPGSLGLHAALTGAPFSAPMLSRWDSPIACTTTSAPSAHHRRRCRAGGLAAVEPVTSLAGVVDRPSCTGTPLPTSSLRCASLDLGRPTAANLIATRSPVPVGDAGGSASRPSWTRWKMF